MNRLRNALQTKEIPQRTFLNIEGEFDNTSHKAIRDSLILKGVGNTKALWTSKMLESKEIEAPTGRKSTIMKASYGYAQGRVAGERTGRA